MRTRRPFTMAMAGIATLALSWPASSAPLMNHAGLAGAATPFNHVERVQHWHGHGHHHHGGGAGAAIGLGIAGALIGGAIAANQARAYAPPPGYAVAPGYAPGGDAVAYCMQRYRSYDPGSGTYLNYDGNRYPCP